MADSVALEILTRGVDDFNKWRCENPTREIDLVNADLAKRNLTGVNFSKVDLRTLKAAGAILVGADLSGAHLNEGDLSGCDLRNAKLIHAKLERADLTGVNGGGAQFESAQAREAKFNDAELTKANFKELEGIQCDFSGATMRGCDLRNAKLMHSQLNQTILENAILEHANLGNAKGLHVKFENALLSGAHMRNASFSRCAFKGAQLVESQLIGGNFSESDFSRADLRNANLGEARLLSVDLSDAKLDSASLRDTKLIKADLRRSSIRLADAQHANLNSSMFSGAVISETDLRGVNLTYANDILFSGNEIAGYRINHKTSAPWLTLKQEYTGKMSIYHLLLMVAFFAPYLAKAVYWAGLASLVERGVIDSSSEQESWMLLSLLIGLDRGFWYALSAGVFGAYNVCRWWIVWKMLRLRDREEETHTTPDSSSYILLHKLHSWLLRWIVYGSVVSFLGHLVSWLFVRIPISP